MSYVTACRVVLKSCIAGAKAAASLGRVLRIIPIFEAAACCIAEALHAGFVADADDKDKGRLQKHNRFAAALWLYFRNDQSLFSSVMPSMRISNRGAEMISDSWK